MKKKYIFLLLLLLPFTVQAQRMYIENDNVYIEAFGLNSDITANFLQLAAKKQSKEDGGRTNYHVGLSAWQNVLITPKFQIATKELGLSSWYEGNGYDTHLNPVESGCATYSQNADHSDIGEWRVPTINEAMFMLIYADYLTNDIVPGFVGGHEGVKIATSTTHTSTQQAYYFLWKPSVFLPSYMGYGAKTADNWYIRCIRDISQ